MSGSDDTSLEVMLVSLWLIKHGDVALSRAQFRSLKREIFDMTDGTHILTPQIEGFVEHALSEDGGDIYHITDKAKQILAGEPNG